MEPFLGLAHIADVVFGAGKLINKMADGFYVVIRCSFPVGMQD